MSCSQRFQPLSQGVISSKPPIIPDREYKSDGATGNTSVSDQPKGHHGETLPRYCFVAILLCASRQPDGALLGPPLNLNGYNLAVFEEANIFTKLALYSLFPLQFSRTKSITTLECYSSASGGYSICHAKWFTAVWVCLFLKGPQLHVEGGMGELGEGLKLI